MTDSEKEKRIGELNVQIVLSKSRDEAIACFEELKTLVLSRSAGQVAKMEKEKRLI